ncbi:MAG: secretin and TonB N-terminal domain-containing protein [Planctomycetota bacterium]|nr:secretin and TonB N-terminal domain-containing protein [Planctomycetota bacterium]
MKKITELPSALVLACVTTGGRLYRRTGRVIAPAVLVILLAAGLAVAQQAGPDTSKPADNKVKFDRKGGVDELHVRGVDLCQVLQMLSIPNKVNIITNKEVSGTVTVDLYNVTFTEALDAVLRSAGFEYVRKDNFVYVYTPKQFAEILAAERKLQLATKVFKLNYITAEDAKTLIKPAMSEDGAIETTPAAEIGVVSDAEDAGGNALATEDVLVVKDYPENLKKITAILSRLDVRPQQILIETTILRASLTENNALGIDFNALAGIDFRTMGYTSTDLTDLTPGAVPAAELDRPRANFNTDFAATVPPGGVSIGFVYNQVRVLLRALETITDVVVLANPKLLVMNKQRGEVMIGNKDGYLTTTVTETTATQTVEFLETGTQLIVRPYIGSDGYIRLEIHPEDSTGGLTADRLPFEQTTECTSNVLVKDGHTIVIGGLFRERTTSGRSQVPGLGNIPIAGVLFRERSDATVREEVIILITPHIIKHPTDEAVSEQYKDEIDHIRLGLRREMMWFGRSRLAQTQMRWARHHLAGGNRSKALWDLNMTLSLEPRMSEAIRLKERLTKEAIWAHEPRNSDTGYVIERMIMSEIGQPPEKVMVPLKPMDGMLLEKEIRDALGIGRRLELPLEQSGGAPVPPATRAKE